MEYRVIDHNAMSLRSEPAHDQSLIVSKGKNKIQVTTDARNKYSHVPTCWLDVERLGASGKWEAAGRIQVGK